jgi:hypothetical protein
MTTRRPRCCVTGRSGRAMNSSRRAATGMSGSFWPGAAGARPAPAPSTFAARAESGVGWRIALIGQTAADVRDVIVEGESGILATASQCYPLRAEQAALTWPNGAVATTYAGDSPTSCAGHSTIRCGVTSWPSGATPRSAGIIWRWGCGSARPARDRDHHAAPDPADYHPARRQPDVRPTTNLSTHRNRRTSASALSSG